VAKIVKCDCGFTTDRTDDDDQLVEQVRQHGREAHNMDVTRDQALAMAQEV
jgi:predicted small metal-binding protein